MLVQRADVTPVATFDNGQASTGRRVAVRVTDQNGILDFCAGGVADPLETQRPDRAPDARRPGRLAGVDGGTQAQAPGSLVDGSERLGRERLLRATQADADHAELAARPPASRVAAATWGPVSRIRSAIRTTSTSVTRSSLARMAAARGCGRQAVAEVAGQEEHLAVADPLGGQACKATASATRVKSSYSRRKRFFQVQTSMKWAKSR